MKKLIISLITMVLTVPLFAANPSVKLQTVSLGYPYNKTFTVNATFSEPVVGFGTDKVNITNGTVISVTGGTNQPIYTLTIQPMVPGLIKMFIPENSVVSLSSGAPNSVSNTLNINALDPSLHPSSNFNLKQWTLTLPIPLGKRANAVTIGQTTLNGVPSMNNGYTNPSYFFTDPVSGAMNFVVPLNGATTPGSGYSRCELLEILPGASPTWKLSTFATNTLTASLLVNHVPPIEKRFVIGQIHDKGNRDIYGHTASNSPLLKLYYDANKLDPNKNPCNGCIYAQIRLTPSQANFLKIVNLVHDIPLNTLFTYQITLLRNGSLKITANNSSTTIQLNTSINNTIGWGAQSLYFKAGAYNLEHDSTEGGADSFYSLSVIHA